MSKKRKNGLKNQGVSSELAKKFASASKRNKGVTVKSIKKAAGN